MDVSERRAIYKVLTCLTLSIERGLQISPSATMSGHRTIRLAPLQGSHRSNLTLFTTWPQIPYFFNTRGKQQCSKLKKIRPENEDEVDRNMRK